jgi:hypothetical protein
MLQVEAEGIKTDKQDIGIITILLVFMKISQSEIKIEENNVIVFFLIY